MSVASALRIGESEPLSDGRANQLAGADACTIYEYDEGSEEFHLRATHNLDPEFAEAIRAMGRAAEMGQPVQVADIMEPGAYQSSLRAVLIGGGTGRRCPCRSCGRIRLSGACP